MARALSKLGFCSRSQAVELIRAGRVALNEKVQLNPEIPVDLARDRVKVDGELIRRMDLVYLALNKPQGLVTTAADERGRETVFRCFAGHDLPFVAPVGRLDKASEGLLLFTNDTVWAARITDPATGPEKTYHVQVDSLADETLLRRLQEGISSEGELLRAKRATILRLGEKNSWLEIVLDEGRNRHIRRMLQEAGAGVLRLVRVAIGPLTLGQLPKGQFRHLTAEEVRGLGRAA